MGKSGCYALGALARDSQRNRMEIAEVGGIVAALQAMASHPSKADVQGAACMALGELASQCPENAAVIAKHGGIQAIERAICAHPMLKNNGSAVITACRKVYK